MCSMMCCIMLCYAMLCCVMLCYVMLCCVVLYDVLCSMMCCVVCVRSETRQTHPCLCIQNIICYTLTKSLNDQAQYYKYDK